jgi:lipoic acid synthetase
MRNETNVPKPAWIKVKLPFSEGYLRLRELMRQKTLHTVCEKALCPNMAECWGRGTATFLILGDICTRNCGFCAVQTGRPVQEEGTPDEATQVADAVASMGLRHAVITSVTRDDLWDGGAKKFAHVIRSIHTRVTNCTVEVLIPDFEGSTESLQEVLAARPEILGHNVETVPRLYPDVRPQANYRRSIDLLQKSKDLNFKGLTKSGIMVGLGEKLEELLRTLDDLRSVHCDILTVGQYLRPTKKHLPVIRYYSPEEFEMIKRHGYEKGFRWVEAGPLVRSSYHAAEQAKSLRP